MDNVLTKLQKIEESIRSGQQKGADKTHLLEKRAVTEKTCDDCRRALAVAQNELEKLVAVHQEIKDHEVKLRSQIDHFETRLRQQQSEN